MRKSTRSMIAIYANVRNDNKRLEVAKYADGHINVIAFMQWDTPHGQVVNRLGGNRRVRWHKADIEALLRDYYLIGYRPVRRWTDR